MTTNKVKQEDPDAPSEKWPEGKYVCTVCHEKKTCTHFSGIIPICILCSAKRQKHKLAAAMAVRKELANKKKRQALKARQRKGGRNSAKKRAAQEKERAVEIKKAKKIVERDASIIAQQLAPEARAEIELASRTLARRSLLHYTERNVKGYEAGWVHEDICRRLEKFMRDVEDRKSPRLMLALPPRAGKSEIASVQFPSWVLGHHADWEFISASYSVELPLKFSRIIRASINSPGYKVIFPSTTLAKDSQAAEAWVTNSGGGYRASGVAGGITGMGAHCLVIDDPVKDHEDADSENSREKTWDWYGSTAYTRLAPGGGVLVIGTRWSDDDLSGRLERTMHEALKELADLEDELKKMRFEARTPEQKKEVEVFEQQVVTFSDSVDRWEIIKYPAIATNDEYLDPASGGIKKIDGGEPKKTWRRLRKKGEALHPARFPLSLLNKYKRTMQPRHWSALYQQNPTPDEGMFFTKDMIRYRPSTPDFREMLRFAAWDLAIGQRTSSDWTVGVIGAIDWDDNLWVLDMIRGKWGTHQIADVILTTHIRYDLVMTGIEKGQLELAIKPQLERLMRKRGKYISLAEGKEALNPITDKIIRARPLQGRMQQGTVLFPMDQPWVESLVNELLRFPTGLHDDIVDAMSWLARMTMRQQPPPHPATLIRRANNETSWRDRLSGIMAGSKHFMSR